jgi:hypothetical protein
VESNIAILWCVCCEVLVESNIAILWCVCCEGVVESNIAILWCVCYKDLFESSSAGFWMTTMNICSSPTITLILHVYCTLVLYIFFKL